MDLQARCFERLQVIRDDVPRTGPVNMALDEVMLNQAGTIPTLRIYRWARPWVSFGYFEPADMARRWGRGTPVVRRLTGGGMVDHGDDLTYTLILPRTSAFAELRPITSYGRIHSAIAFALERSGLCTAESAAQPELLSENGWDNACFARPVRFDLIADGRKIAGAAQRRTRAGVLHQGSIRVDPKTVSGDSLHWKNRLRLELPAALAAEYEIRAHTSLEINSAHMLATTRYATAAWTNRL